MPSKDTDMPPMKNYLSLTIFHHSYDELPMGERLQIDHIMKTLGDNLEKAFDRARIPDDFQRALSPMDHAKLHATKVANRKHNDMLDFAVVIMRGEFQ